MSFIFTPTSAASTRDQARNAGCVRLSGSDVVSRGRTPEVIADNESHVDDSTLKHLCSKLLIP